jgi:hypothetical protein
VKTRYRQTDIPCTVTALDDDRIEVRLTNRLRPSPRASLRSSTAVKCASAAGSSNSACRCPLFNSDCTHKGERVAKNYYDITLALAGICQSARLVQQLAHQGHCDSDALHVSLNSIIDLNPARRWGVRWQ